MVVVTSYSKMDEMEKRRTAASLHFQAENGQDGSETTAMRSAMFPSKVSLSKFMKKKRKRLENSVERGSSVTNLDATTEVPSETPPKLTEMEKQVVSLQNRYPDMLLLFECGYRMRIFGSDAETAARVLGIRSQRHRAFVETSVPVHRTHFHSRRLVNAGLKVGIVKQLSTAARTNGQPLERGVVQVLTRATIPSDDETDDSVGEEPCDSTREDAEVPSRGDLDDGGRFILSIVEETIHTTRLFAKLVHEMDVGNRNENQLETVRIGLFGHDIHSGESVFDEFEDDVKRSRLRGILDRLSPVEFVLPTGGVSPATEQIILAYAHQAQNILRVDTTARSVCRVERIPFTAEESTESSPPIRLAALVRLCIAGMASYLKSLLLPSALALHHLHILNNGRSLSDLMTKRMRLSQAAVQDLGIFCDKSSDSASLFSILNHTRTGFGARRLRDWIRYPLVEVDEIQDRLNGVEYLSTVGSEGAIVFESLRNEVLPSAAPIERLLQQLHLRRASPRSVVKLIQTLAEVEALIVEIVSEGGGQTLQLRSRNLLAAYPRCRSDFITVLEQLEVRSAVANELERTISRQWAKFPRDQVEYDSICSELETLEFKFTEALDQCRRVLNVSTLSYCSHRAGGNGKAFDHLVAVARSEVAIVPGDWIVVSSTKVIVRYYPRQVRVLQIEQDVLLERKTQLINAVWLEVVGSIDRTVYATGMRAVDILADLDAVCSLSTATRLYPGYSRPAFGNPTASGRHLEIVKGRHPVLDLEASHGSLYIAGDVKLSGCGAALVISGPNMGGKSTLLRMTALLVLLAQIGMFVPADSMEVRCFDAIQTRMHRVSSSGAGAEELQELAVIAKTATPSTLVLLDEVGYGLTSRQAKTLAFNTVKYLLKSVKCCVLMATHMTDIARRLRDESEDSSDAQVQIQELAHEIAVPMSTLEESTAGVVYHYTTRDGIATRSFALEAAAMAGIPASVLEAVGTEGEKR